MAIWPAPIVRDVVKAYFDKKDQNGQPCTSSR